MINSIALGDIDRDGEIEIVTGGNFEEQNCVIAQLCIWNGFTFMLEDIKTWSYSDSSTITTLNCSKLTKTSFHRLLHAAILIIVPRMVHRVVYPRYPSGVIV